MKFLLLAILTINYIVSGDSTPIDHAATTQDKVEIEKQKLVKFPEDLIETNTEKKEEKIKETKRILEEIDKINQSLGYLKKTDTVKPTLLWNSDEYLFPSDNMQPFHSQSLTASKETNGNVYFLPFHRAVKSQRVTTQREINSKFHNGFDKMANLQHSLRKMPEKDSIKTFTKYYYDTPAENLDSPIYYAIPVRLNKEQNGYFNQQHTIDSNLKGYQIVGNLDHIDQLMKPLPSDINEYRLYLLPQKLFTKQPQAKTLPNNEPAIELESREDKLSKTSSSTPQANQTVNKRLGMKPAKTKDNIDQPSTALQPSSTQKTIQQQQQQQQQYKQLPSDNRSQATNDSNPNAVKWAFQNIFKLPFKQEVKPEQQQQQQQLNTATIPKPKPPKIPQLLQFSTLAASNPVIMQAQQQSAAITNDFDYTDYHWIDEMPQRKKNVSGNPYKDTDYQDSEEEKIFFGHNPNSDVQKEALKQGGSIIIHKLKVRKGGIAIAGPGGVATAGSGGTAIVGPGGYVLTHPRSLTIAGPGTKVIAIPENVDLKDALQRTNVKNQSLPREGRIVATGPTVYYAPPTSSLENRKDF